MILKSGANPVPASKTSPEMIRRQPHAEPPSLFQEETSPQSIGRPGGVEKN